MGKREKHRVTKNKEQATEFITRDLMPVMDKNLIYSKNEFCILLNPIAKYYYYPVHEAVTLLVDNKIIKEHKDGSIIKYSLMPNKGMTKNDELLKKVLNTYEETAWLAKHKKP